MKKQKLSLFFILGIGLIVISLSFLAFFQIRMHIGARSSQKVLAKIEQIIREKTVGVPGGYANPSMPVLEMDGTDYVAVLQIPAMDVALPVAYGWDSGKLFRSPARFCGSAYDNTLVIGGADHTKQFGFCDSIENGTLVTVTDMTGTRFAYVVSKVDRAKQAQNEWLGDENYDLTLFCRDTYTMEYVAVRCTLTYQEST